MLLWELIGEKNFEAAIGVIGIGQFPRFWVDLSKYYFFRDWEILYRSSR